MGNTKIMISASLAGSGKDTMADYLVSDYNYEKVALADMIYDICRKVFNMQGKDRRLLQHVGESMREIDPDVWVKNTLKSVAEKELQGFSRIVITDLRRENEYYLLKDAGFMPVRVVCDVATAVKRIMSRDGKCDESLLYTRSETGIGGFSMDCIDNNGTPKEFQEKIDNFMRGLGIEKSKM